MTPVRTSHQNDNREVQPDGKCTTIPAVSWGAHKHQLFRAEPRVQMQHACNSIQANDKCWYVQGVMQQPQHTRSGMRGGAGAQKHCMRAHAAAALLPDGPAAEEAAAAAAVQAAGGLALQYVCITCHVGQRCYIGVEAFRSMKDWRQTPQQGRVVIEAASAP